MTTHANGNGKPDVTQYRDPATVAKIVKERQANQPTPQQIEKAKKNLAAEKKFKAEKKAQPKKTAKAEKKAPTPKGIKDFSMAGFVTGLMVSGITWDKLVRRVKAEAEQRGLRPWPLGQLKGHARNRAKTGRWSIEETDVGIRMNRLSGPAKKVEKPTKGKKVATTKPAAKKNGKATGRRTKKTTENGRQTVEPVAEPVTEQKPEAA